MAEHDHEYAVITKVFVSGSRAKAYVFIPSIPKNPSGTHIFTIDGGQGLAKYKVGEPVFVSFFLTPDGTPLNLRIK